MTGGRRAWPFGRRRAQVPGGAEPEPPADLTTEVPCLPCEERQQQRSSRPFSLDLAPAELVPDDLVPALRDGVAHAIVGAEVVLFDPRRSRSTLLNPSAALIWATIDGTTTVAGIVDDLAAETGVDRAVMDDDVRRAIAGLQVAGIVESPPVDGSDHPTDDTSPAGATHADVGARDDLATARTRGHLLLHAAAVARGDDVVVVAGPSGPDRSRLTAALVGLGFEHLTDEVVAIDPASRAIRADVALLDPGPRTLLGLGPATNDTVAATAPVDPDGAGAARGGGKVALVVLPRDPADDEPTPPPSTPAETLVELLGNTVETTFGSSAGLADPLGALAGLVADVPVLHLGHRPPTEAASIVVAALDDAGAQRHDRG